MQKGLTGERQIEGKTNLYELLANLTLKINHGRPTKDYWEHDIGNFKIALNGKATPLPVAPNNCMGIKIPPYSFAIWCKGYWTGWLNQNHLILMEEYSSKTNFNVSDMENIVKEEIERVGA